MRFVAAVLAIVLGSVMIRSADDNAAAEREILGMSARYETIRRRPNRVGGGVVALLGVVRLIAAFGAAVR